MENSFTSSVILDFASNILLQNVLCMERIAIVEYLYEDHLQ